MNRVILFYAAVMVFAFSGALGLTCNRCVPDPGSFKLCTTQAELTQVDCATRNETVPGTNISVVLDACITAKIHAVFQNIRMTSYVFDCGVQNNGSDASMPNCSMNADYLCGIVAQEVSAIPGITIESCNAQCCVGENCNHMGQQPSESTGPTTQTTAMTSPIVTSGVEHLMQPQLVGFLMIFVTLILQNIEAAWPRG
ncbi:PREDICTED: uncharacterized protein LOC107337487 [Acropora digitifera]|uniref:uncharacterized protein LOC107337487 n=1 Tax=Acropora digitifera TaxID=70779 RepID=UPI00077A70B6|nr:PREDICTED: uncharacterized protein LOC107337487 [Acropora digitifera]